MRHLTKQITTEFRIQGRHWRSYVPIVLSFLLGVFVINKQLHDMDIERWGVYFLIHTYAIELIILPIIVAIFAALATCRDEETGMTEFVYASAVSLAGTFWSRFIAFVLLCSIVYLSFAIGIVAGLINFDGVSYSRAILALGWAFFVLTLPNILLVSAIVFSIGLKSRNSIVLYLLAAAMFFSYQYFMMLNGSPMMAQRVAVEPALTALYAWFDPYGLSTYFEQVGQWEPLQKNTQYPSLTVKLLINRLAVISLAVLIITFAIRHSSQHIDIGRQSIRSRFNVFNPFVDYIRSLTARLSILPLGWLNGFKTISMVNVTLMEWRLSYKTRLFFAMSAFMTMILASEIYAGYMHLENLGVKAIPSTMITINRYVFDVLPRFGSLFIVLLSAELCWRDRQSRMHELIDYTAVSNRDLFAGRLLAVTFLPIFFVSLAIVVSIVMQLTFGGNIDWMPYLWLYGYVGLPMLLFAMMCVVIHMILMHKYLALVSTFILFLWLETSLAASLGLGHPLWRLGNLPTLTYSEITAFGNQSERFWIYMLFRLSLVFIGILMAIKFLRRGYERIFTTQSSHTTQISTVYRPLTIVSLATFLIYTVVLASSSGDEQFYNSPEERHIWKANYEKNFAHLENLPSLTPGLVTTNIDISGADYRVTIAGSMQLVNRNNEAVSIVAVMTPKPYIYQSIELANASLQSTNDRFQTHIFELNKPLQPAESTELSFQASFTQNPHASVATDNFLSEGFTYIRLLRYLPWVGYAKHYRLTDSTLRREFELPVLNSRTIEQDIAHYAGDMSELYYWAELRTTIFTDSHHTAIASGRLIRQWQEGDRNAFAYQTHGVIRNLGHVVSLDMAKHQEEVAGINVEVFYPHGKSGYAEKHMAAIRDTLNYGLEHFGPVNTFDLRLIPAPSFFPATGYALPQSIFIGEAVGFHVNQQDSTGFDHLYRRTAHEVAHQWWGHSLNGAATEGEAVLVETLAKYTELVLLEQKYGRDTVKRLVAYEQQRYFSGRARSNNEELPMYRADASHLVYSKGSAMMFALKEQLGEAVINTALRHLLQQHMYPAPPATTLDLMSYLKQDINQQQAQLVDDWFREVNVHDMSFSSVKLEHLAAGYRIDFCIKDSNAEFKSVNLRINDKVGDMIEQINLFNTEQGKDELCNQVVVGKKPARLVIDPDLWLLDRNRENNSHRF